MTGRFARTVILAVASLAGLAAAVERLLAGRHEAPTLGVDTFVVVDAPAERVWNVLADVPAQPRWMRDLKSVELLDPPPVRAGTRALGLVRVLGIPVPDPVTITAFEPPTRFAIRHDGVFGGEGTIELEPGADGRSTVVRWRERLLPPVLPHLASRLGPPILRRVFQADLHRLRGLIEERA